LFKDEKTTGEQFKVTAPPCVGSIWNNGINVLFFFAIRWQNDHRTRTLARRMIDLAWPPPICDRRLCTIMLSRYAPYWF